jgi:hypothetical protein
VSSAVEIVAGVILRGLRELFRFLFWVPVYSRDSKVESKSVVMISGRISLRRIMEKYNRSNDKCDKGFTCDTWYNLYLLVRTVFFAEIPFIV